MPHNNNNKNSSLNPKQRQFFLLIDNLAHEHPKNTKSHTITEY